MNHRNLFLAGIFFLFTIFPGLAQVQKIGEYVPDTFGPAIRVTDAGDPSNITLVDSSLSSFLNRAGNIAQKFNRVYVTDGEKVRQFNRNDLNSGQLKAFSSPNEVLDVETGLRREQVVVLDRSSLRVVDFRSAQPMVLGSFPIEATQSSWGDLLHRFGDYLYVADCANKGFRVLDISNPANILEIASYQSNLKGGGKLASDCPTDLQINNNLVSLVIRNSLELVSVVDFLHPEPSFITHSKFKELRETELRKNFVFLADGSLVHIVDLRPGSFDFGKKILSFETGAPITGLEMRGEKLIVLCGEQGYQVWDVTPYS